MAKLNYVGKHQCVATYNRSDLPPSRCQCYARPGKRMCRVHKLLEGVRTDEEQAERERHGAI